MSLIGYSLPNHYSGPLRPHARFYGADGRVVSWSNFNP